MRGHESLLKLRMAGKVPRSVWVSLFPLQKWAIEWAARNSADAEIQIDDDEPINRLDLRCLVGLDPVYVNGPDGEQTKRLADACIKAGAKRVLASYFAWTHPEHLRLVRMTETTTEGVRQWQA